MTFDSIVGPAIVPGSVAVGPQPELRGEDGLVLRPWQDADAAAFHGAYRDPAIGQWHTVRPATPERAREWFGLYREDWARERAAHWAVTGGGELLGRMAVKSFALSDGIASIAYWVLPAARGQGVAPRALEAVCGWAFGAGFARLELTHSTRNDASCRVAAKCGFELEGTMRSAALHADGRHDMHLHSRLTPARAS
jgi:RimJ/RimL family protein N-acetyltransferase